MAGYKGSELDIAIVGGGAAGMTAAIFAARGGASVTILEADDRPGRKLLRTGSGRCNLTNEGCRLSKGRSSSDAGKADPENRIPPRTRYFGADPGFAEEIFAHFSFEDTLAFFNGLGLPLREFDGWYYPFNEEAASVRDVLLDELSRLHVKIKCNTPVRSIRKLSDGRFELAVDGWSYRAKAVLLAAGSPAALQENAPTAYTLAEALGHTVAVPLPALTGLYVKDRKLASQWAGVRARAKFTLISDGRTLRFEAGQIQFTAKGISGIPVMNASAAAIRELKDGHKVTASLDFLEGLHGGLSDYRHVLPHRLYAPVLGNTSDPHIASDRLRNFRIEISGYGELREAQGASGGVLTSEIDAEDMQSRICPGLFFAGEILDLIGECGGYNLQLAWSSGASAGRGLASFISIV